MSTHSLGMSSTELQNKPYARFWNPNMQPLSEAATKAVVSGPVAAPLLLAFDETHRLLEPGLHDVENGFGFGNDGSLRVALRTEMPGTTPEMVDWWFGWHSDEPQRYKLWHPRAHVHAEWAPSIVTSGYVGRVSTVEEYIGSQLGKYAIQFVEPSNVGLRITDTKREVAICARVGFAALPVDIGYLIHHVRRVPGGSEMRSRFWIGGAQAGGRDGNIVGEAAAQVARFARRPTVQDGVQLLVHCAQEMAHLATFLPALFAELGAAEAGPYPRAVRAG